jgi:hypothetical protein
MKYNISKFGLIFNLSLAIIIISVLFRVMRYPFSDFLYEIGIAGISLNFVLKAVKIEDKSWFDYLGFFSVLTLIFVTITKYYFPITYGLVSIFAIPSVVFLIFHQLTESDEKQDDGFKNKSQIENYQFGKSDLEENKEESFGTSNPLKQQLTLLGYIGLGISVLGILFKYLHLPASGPLIIVGFVSVAIQIVLSAFMKK